MLIRVSTNRSGYRRGGLVFNDQTARRMAGGRLAILIDQAKAETLGSENLVQLTQDPNIVLERCGDDGLTAGERHGAFLERVRKARYARPARRSESQVDIHIHSGVEKSASRLVHTQEVAGSSPAPAPTIAPPARLQIPPAGAGAEASRTGASADQPDTPKSDQVRLARPPAPTGNGKTVGAQLTARAKAEGAKAPSSTHSPKAAKPAAKPKGKRT